MKLCREDAPLKLYDGVPMSDSNCPICAGISYVCGKCGREVDAHSHEGDYSCKKHGFIQPIRRCEGP